MTHVVLMMRQGGTADDSNSQGAAGSGPSTPAGDANPYAKFETMEKPPKQRTIAGAIGTDRWALSPFRHDLGPHVTQLLYSS